MKQGEGSLTAKICGDKSNTVVLMNGGLQWHGMREGEKEGEE